MRNRGVTAAALVLAVLLGVLYWSNRHKPADTGGLSPLPSPTEPAPNILTLNEGDINRIELKRKEGEQIVLARDSSGKWSITAPQAMAADDSVVSGMVSTLSSFSSDRLVEEKAASLDKYGLTAPRLTVTVTDKNNVAHRVLIGDDTPTGNAAYARLDGDPRVFTIANFNKTTIDKSLDDLRDKRLITATADKVTRFELTANQQTIEFSRDKEQWQILKPRPLRADGTVVDELLRKVVEARMEPNTAADETKTPGDNKASDNKSDAASKGDASNKSDAASKAAAAFSSGTLIATAKMTTDSGTQQLEVRKNKDNYYAKSSVTDGVFRVASDLGQSLDKKLDDFRDKKVFDFGFGDPGKIEIHDGSKTYFLTKSGEDWWSADGKKFDPRSAESLVGKLRDLTATDFADSGFGAAALEITVTSADGKHVEKVSLAKGAKNAIARREGDASLYLLDANLIADLQKLAADLKPVAAGGK